MLARSATRASLLDSALARIDEGVQQRAVLYARENGKTVAEARGELGGLAARFRLVLEHVDELSSPRAMSAPNGKTIIGYRPYGVVVSIVPWNSPVSLAFNQIVSALFAGNTVVVKAAGIVSVNAHRDDKGLRP